MDGLILRITHLQRKCYATLVPVTKDTADCIALIINAVSALIMDAIISEMTRGVSREE